MNKTSNLLIVKKDYAPETTNAVLKDINHYGNEIVRRNIFEIGKYSGLQAGLQGYILQQG